MQVKLDSTESEKSVDKLQSKTEKLQKSFENTGKNLTLGLTLPITGLVTAGVVYNSSMETLTASFKTMTGSAERAGAIMSEIKEIAKTTPFETKGLAETTQLLMNYGLTSENAISKMKMLGDISQGSAEKMNRIAMAYGQMSSAGKVSLEDVKQMIEAGFNPLNEISNTTGESMSSLYDRISNGTISVDEITASMQRSTSEGGKYFGSMQTQSETTAGKISTLKDGFNEATGALTLSLLPTLMLIIGKLTELSNWFSNLTAKQQNTILTILGLVAVIGPLLIIFSKIITAIQVIGGALSFLWPIIQGIGIFFASTFGVILISVGAVVGALIWAFFYIKANWLAFSTGFMYIARGIGDGIAWVFKGIINIIIGAINTVTRAINVLMAGVLLPFNAIILGLNQIPGVRIPYLRLSIPKIPYLATGTNNVQREGLAYLHQGEAVVPKKYNPAMGGGQNIVVQMPDIYLDNEKVGRAITPSISRTLRLAGAR